MPTVEEYKELMVKRINFSCLWSKNLENEREHLKEKIGIFLGLEQFDKFQKEKYEKDMLVELTYRSLEKFRDIIDSSNVSLIPKIYTNDIITYKIVKKISN